MLSCAKSIPTLGAVVLAAVVLTGCSDDDTNNPTPTPPVKMHVRKNAKDLTAEERADYVAAVQKLKDTPSPFDSTLNYYDQFVEWHHLSSLCAEMGGHTAVSHMNLSFLAWHRQFLYRFEEALREVSGKDITIPYWDWTDPTSEPVVFGDDFMGGEGDPAEQFIVKTGPFADWEFQVQPTSWPPGAHLPRLVRKFNTHYDADPMTMRPEIDIKLPTPAEVDAVLKIEQFNSAPYDISVDATKNFQVALEGWIGYAGMMCDPNSKVMVPVPGPMSKDVIHSMVHPWVAGIQLTGDPMQPLIKGTMAWSTSPNDPVFFLNHANVDRVWYEWQELHGKDNYAPKTGGPHGTNLNDALEPFPAFDSGPNTVEELLDSDKLLIKYE